MQVVRTLQMLMMERLQKLMDEIGEFSDGTFGKERPYTAPLHHLKLEVQEAIDDPRDSEFADCMMLLLDSYRKAGGNASKLVDEAFKKLEECKRRDWGEPDENGVVQHVRK